MSKIIPETPADYDHTRIIELPDGFFWVDQDSGERYGPFVTLLEAVQDMEYRAEGALEPAASLEEVEDELGLTAWVDPDTGELAEDTFTHLEDH